MKLKRLTPAQKKLIWSPVKSNAGAGWQSTFSPIDPIKQIDAAIFRQPKTMSLDKVIK